jgi:hypothetical protein
MIDNYTKAILTLIALALLALVGQNFSYTKPATAAPANCGELQNPCAVLVCKASATAGFFNCS